MYTDKNGRVWSSEENYKKYAFLVRKNLKSSLAVEDFSDLNNEVYDNNLEVYENEVFSLLNKYRLSQKNLNEAELLELVSLISVKFDELFDKIGREKFIFYDDGDVLYIWN